MIKWINNHIFNPTTLRWLDWILTTSIAILICILFKPYLSKMHYKYHVLTSHMPLITKYLITSLISGCMLFTLNRLGGFHFSHFKNTKILRYPPMWLAGIVGTIIFVKIIFIQNNIRIIFNSELFFSQALWNSSIAAGFIITILIIFLSELKTKKYQLKKKNNHQAFSFKTIMDNPRQIFTWIEEEKAINYPWEDMFGLSIIASRIARTLLYEKLRTIGVVGTYGCGKTSLLNLVEYYLNDEGISDVNKSLSQDGLKDNQFEGEILVCKIDGWGRSKGSVAEQVLSMAVSRIQKNIDCLSLINMPVNYRKALEGVKSSWTSIIAALLNTTRDPVKQLEKLDGVLVATNTRLIIFLEDLDRNLSDEIIRDELPSLLDRLKYLKNVSFILAIGTEHQYSNILIRVCDHVEAIV